MFRAAGGILIILACTYYGFLSGHRLNMRICGISELTAILEQIKSNIGYSVLSLPEIFCKAAGDANMVMLKEMFQYISMQLQKSDMQDFEAVWTEGIRMLSDTNVFRQRELESLSKLSKISAFLDKNMQLKSIDMVREELQEINEQLKQEQRPKIKIYRISGFMAGVVIVIALI